MEDDKVQLIHEKCIAANPEIETRADLLAQIRVAILAQKQGIQDKLEKTGPMFGITERRLSLDELNGQETLLRWFEKGYFPGTKYSAAPSALLTCCMRYG
jgi:hypothetical protein